MSPLSRPGYYYYPFHAQDTHTTTTTKPSLIQDNASSFHLSTPHRHLFLSIINQSIKDRVAKAKEERYQTEEQSREEFSVFDAGGAFQGQRHNSLNSGEICQANTWQLPRTADEQLLVKGV
jgi:hypothetical protein